MNYTENYQLNQWESTDRVLREDFNEDNRKIEEALKTAGAQIAVGTYVGTNQNNQTPRYIELGFSPTAVFVWAVNSARQGSYEPYTQAMATREQPFGEHLVLSESGFTVRNVMDEYGYTFAPILNSISYRYNYLAIG